MASYGTITYGLNTWTITYLTNPTDLANGLSGVNALSPGYAVLFDMNSSSIITVTTMNMLFNLDIVFTNASGVVTEVWRNIAPGQVFQTEHPAMYFIEMNAGEAVGVEVGDTGVVVVTSTDPTDDPITTTPSTMTAQWFQYVLMGIMALPAVIKVGSALLKNQK